MKLGNLIIQSLLGICVNIVVCDIVNTVNINKVDITRTVTEHRDQCLFQMCPWGTMVSCSFLTVSWLSNGLLGPCASAPGLEQCGSFIEESPSRGMSQHKPFPLSVVFLRQNCLIHLSRRAFNGESRTECEDLQQIALQRTSFQTHLKAQLILCTILWNHLGKRGRRNLIAACSFSISFCCNYYQSPLTEIFTQK